MNLLNKALNSLFDLFFWPFAGLNPMWGLTAISLVAGVAMLWIFGKTSNQTAIKSLKNRIRGNLLAVRLYQHDLGLVARLQGRLLLDTFKYMRYSMFPMLIMIVPVLIILVQMNYRFSVRPAEPGKSILVKMAVREAGGLDGALALETPEAVEVETPPVRVSALSEADWRIKPEEEGRHTLLFRMGDEEVEKEFIVGEGWGKISAIRTGKGFFDSFLWPGEPTIPAKSPVRSVEVRYQPLELSVFGFGVHWLVYFFIMSIVFGFAFKGVLKVEV